MTSNPAESAAPAEPTALAQSDVDSLVEPLRPLFRPGTEEQGVQQLRAAPVHVNERHAGPLPSARQLEHYERTLPGAADCIIAMAEREQEHRRGVEKDLVAKEFSLQARGQWIALAALALLLMLIAYVASTGASESAAWLGGVTIVGVQAGGQLVRVGCEGPRGSRETKPHPVARLDQSKGHRNTHLP